MTYSNLLYVGEANTAMQKVVAYICLHSMVMFM